MLRVATLRHERGRHLSYSVLTDIQSGIRELDRLGPPSVLRNVSETHFKTIVIFNLIINIEDDDQPRTLIGSRSLVKLREVENRG